MQVFVTGPARAWLAFPTGIVPNANTPILSGYSTPVPFATAENGFQIIEDVATEPLMNDLGGSAKAFDRCYEGKYYVVAGVLTRYREPVFRALSEIPVYGGAGIFGDAAGSLGTLMGLEQRGVQLWIEYLYGGGGPFGGAGALSKPVHVAGSLPAGVHFYSADWKGPIRRTTGTSPSKIHAVWKCERVYDPFTGASIAGDENCAAIGGLAWEVVP